MSELIDREAAISKIEPWLYSEGRGESEINMLRAVIAELKSLPDAPRWYRVEEPPEEEGRYWCAVRFDGHWIFDAAWYTHDISTVIEVPCCEQVGGFYKGNTEVHPDYWMPIEPPKEDA